MAENTVKLHYNVDPDDFTVAGEASGAVKKVLKQLGFSPMGRYTDFKACVNSKFHLMG